jgi:hypothetical protein
MQLPIPKTQLDSTTVPYSFYPVRVSQSYFTGGGLPPLSSSWQQAAWDTRHRNFILQLNTCSYIPYVTSSLMGLSFTIAAGPCQRSHSGQSPAGFMTFYCLTFETPPTWRARSPYLYTPGTGWPGYTSRHWVPFSSPLMTCRTTVEVFDFASTPSTLSKSKSKSKLCYDRRFRLPVRLGIKHPSGA